ncbi:hypothetical protein [Bacillus horti]|uniref:Uncharacterized protein n=1 Tax=Caldalkalibacillus horti TaxID=77523 RepID=A0ABT9W4B2_9BACI|nr:hypothetical protein [Bacillus horti]MDQ0168084.1 hypothetical protein [Bacillus horti]
MGFLFGGQNANGAPPYPYNGQTPNMYNPYYLQQQGMNGFHPAGGQPLYQTPYGYNPHSFVPTASQQQPYPYMNQDPQFQGHPFHLYPDFQPNWNRYSTSSFPQPSPAYTPYPYQGASSNQLHYDESTPNNVTT